MIDSICFLIINGENDLIFFFLFTFSHWKFAKNSFALNVKASGCVSSSEESNAKNLFRDCEVMMMVYDSIAMRPPSMEPYKGTFNRNGSH